MRTPLQSLLSEQGVVEVDEANVDAFAAGGAPAALLFSGETKRRPEAQDVAVVLREMGRSYRGTVRIGVVAGPAEDRLKTRFGVVVLPTLVLLNGAEPSVSIARIQDWSAYAARFAAQFGPPPALAAE